MVFSSEADECRRQEVVLAAGKEREREMSQRETLEKEQARERERFEKSHEEWAQTLEREQQEKRVLMQQCAAEADAGWVLSPLSAHIR